MVPVECFGNWKAILSKQKFREGVITIQCEYQNTSLSASPSPISSASALESFLTAESYQRCTIAPIPESSITEDIERNILDIGSKFAGCIICFKEFLIASFDAFVHIENVDDCSFAELHHKFEKVRSFFEVSIILHGCIELLSNDGIVFTVEDPVDAFSGSTIRPLKNHMLAGGHCLTSCSQGFIIQQVV